ASRQVWRRVFCVRFSPQDLRAGLHRPIFFGQRTDRQAVNSGRGTDSVVGAPWSVYWIAASVAPRIVFGLSSVPLCPSGAAVWIARPLSFCIGTLQVPGWPAPSPSLIVRRSTLW